VRAIVQQWRAAHPMTALFWRRLARAAHTAVRTGRPTLVAPAPRPPITAAFDGHALTLTLPSGRAINYPGARLAPNTKFEDGEPDLEFFDNARGGWRPARAWFGTLVENVVQGTARDLLAAALLRFAARGLPIVLHCHDEIVAEVPKDSVDEREVLALLLESPAWAAGLPLGGKVHSGPLYLEAPATVAPPVAQATAIDADTEDARTEDADTEDADADEDAPWDDICLTCLDEMRVAAGSHVELVGEMRDDRARAQRESSKFSNDFDGAPNSTPAENVVADANPLPWEGDSAFENLSLHARGNETCSPQPPPPQTSSPSESSGRGNGHDDLAADGFGGFVTDVQGYDRGKINCPFHDDKTPSCQLYADGHLSLLRLRRARLDRRRYR